MTPFRSTWFLLATLTLGFPGPDARAATILNFGGDYVSSTLTGGRAGVASSEAGVGGFDTNDDGDQLDNLRSVPFNGTATWNPTSGYTGPNYYGGIVATRSANSTASTLVTGMHENGSADGIQLGAGSGGSGGGAIRAVVLFAKADFLNGGDTNLVTFDGLSNMSLTVYNVSAGGSPTFQVRFVVRDGASNYYLSESNSTFTGSNGTSFSIANLATQNFAAYTGLADGVTGPIDWDGTSYSTLGSTFGNITGAGFYFQSDSGQTIATKGFSAFSVNAAMVPEPAAGMALLGGFGLLALRRRLPA